MNHDSTSVAAITILLRVLPGALLVECTPRNRVEPVSRTSELTEAKRICEVRINGVRVSPHAAAKLFAYFGLNLAKAKIPANVARAHGYVNDVLPRTKNCP
jgi:hypothetical protein